MVYGIISLQMGNIEFITHRKELGKLVLFLSILLLNEYILCIYKMRGRYSYDINWKYM